MPCYFVFLQIDFDWSLHRSNHPTKSFRQISSESYSAIAIEFDGLLIFPLRIVFSIRTEKKEAIYRVSSMMREWLQQQHGSPMSERKRYEHVRTCCCCAIPQYHVGITTVLVSPRCWYYHDQIDQTVHYTVEIELPTYL